MPQEDGQRCNFKIVYDSPTSEFGFADCTRVSTNIDTMMK